MQAAVSDSSATGGLTVSTGSSTTTDSGSSSSSPSYAIVGGVVGGCVVVALIAVLISRTNKSSPRTGKVNSAPTTRAASRAESVLAVEQL